MAKIKLPTTPSAAGNYPMPSGGAPSFFAEAAAWSAVLKGLSSGLKELENYRNKEAIEDDKNILRENPTSTILENAVRDSLDPNAYRDDGSIDHERSLARADNIRENFSGLVSQIGRTIVDEVMGLGIKTPVVREKALAEVKGVINQLTLSKEILLAELSARTDSITLDWIKVVGADGLRALQEESDPMPFLSNWEAVTEESKNIGGGDAKHQAVEYLDQYASRFFKSFPETVQSQALLIKTIGSTLPGNLETIKHGYKDAAEMALVEQISMSATGGRAKNFTKIEDPDRAAISEIWPLLSTDAVARIRGIETKHRVSEQAMQTVNTLVEKIEEGIRPSPGEVRHLKNTAVATEVDKTLHDSGYYQKKNISEIYLAVNTFLDGHSGNLPKYLKEVVLNTISRGSHTEGDLEVLRKMGARMGINTFFLSDEGSKKVRERLIFFSKLAKNQTPSAELWEKAGKSSEEELAETAEQWKNAELSRWWTIDRKVFDQGGLFSGYRDSFVTQFIEDRLAELAKEMDTSQTTWVYGGRVAIREGTPPEISQADKERIEAMFSEIMLLNLHELGNNDLGSAMSDENKVHHAALNSWQDLMSNGFFYLSRGTPGGGLLRFAPVNRNEVVTGKGSDQTHDPSVYEKVLIEATNNHMPVKYKGQEDWWKKRILNEGRIIRSPDTGTYRIFLPDLYGEDLGGYVQDQNIGSDLHITFGNSKFWAVGTETLMETKDVEDAIKGLVEKNLNAALSPIASMLIKEPEGEAVTEQGALQILENWTLDRSEPFPFKAEAIKDIVNAKGYSDLPEERKHEILERVATQIKHKLSIDPFLLYPKTRELFRGELNRLAPLFNETPEAYPMPHVAMVDSMVVFQIHTNNVENALARAKVRFLEDLETGYTAKDRGDFLRALRKESADKFTTEDLFANYSMGTVGIGMQMLQKFKDVKTTANFAGVRPGLVQTVDKIAQVHKERKTKRGLSILYKTAMAGTETPHYFYEYHWGKSKGDPFYSSKEIVDRGLIDRLVGEPWGDVKSFFDNSKSVTPKKFAAHLSSMLSDSWTTDEKATGYDIFDMVVIELANKFSNPEQQLVLSMSDKQLVDLFKTLSPDMSGEE